MLLIDSSAVELAWANLSWKSFRRFFNHRPGRMSKEGWRKTVNQNQSGLLISKIMYKQKCILSYTVGSVIKFSPISWFESYYPKKQQS